MESGARAIGDVVTERSRMVRFGQAAIKLESFSARAASSTDMLEQVPPGSGRRHQGIPATPAERRLRAVRARAGDLTADGPAASQAASFLTRSIGSVQWSWGHR